MSESLERCDHTDTVWLACDDESCEPHDFQICRDCGEDVD